MKQPKDFDFSQIPSNVQYDVLTLPSKGECYPHKIGKVPVSYLTAADENIIASPNLYHDGKVLDVILSRKILDPRIKPEELTKGDRDAILLWLRATGYGKDFPITAKDPMTGKDVDVTIDLSTFNYRPFDLKGDDDGLFEYKSENGDVIKFKFVTKRDETTFIEDKKGLNAMVGKIGLSNALQDMQNILDSGRIDEEHSEVISQYMSDMVKLVDDIPTDDYDESVDPDIIPIFTESMCLYTVSVNGNDNPEYVKTYIENMRVKEAKAYREYVNNNLPGVDLEVDIERPESDGGGSFKTFLTVDETVLIAI